MNDIVFFALTIILIIRIIGFSITLELYIGWKKRLLIIILTSWIVWIMATVVALVLIIPTTEINVTLMNFLDNYLTSIGVYIYLWGINHYFFEMKQKGILYILIFYSLALLLIGFLVNYDVATFLSLIGVIVMLLTSFFMPILRREEFLRAMGRTTYIYYSILIILIPFMVGSVYILLIGVNYSIVQTGDPIIIILYFIPSIAISILLITLLIHMEYTITERVKDQMKDKYSHDLGNIIQSISLIFSLNAEKPDLGIKQEKEELDTMLKSKIDDARELLKEIRKL